MKLSIFSPMVRVETKDELVESFVTRIEAKDPYTQGHSHHVKVVVETLLERLPVKMKAGLDRERLLDAALLHDVGKIMVPDEVLNKDGALSEEEWAAMRRHPESGVRLLEDTVFCDLAPWVLYHHERMDGQGYMGVKGEDIPLEARIIAVADLFSALRTYRVYRPAKSIAETIRIMDEASGPQIDPEVSKHFLSIAPELLEKLECGCEPCAQRKDNLAALAAEKEAEREAAREKVEAR